MGWSFFWPKKTCTNLNFDAGLLLLNGKQVMSRRQYPMAAAVVIVQMAQALAQAVWLALATTILRVR